MIKHAIQAKMVADRVPKDDCHLVFEIHPGTQTEENPDGVPRPTLKQKNPIVLPKNGPQGVLYGVYLPGEVPANTFVHEEMQKEWAVIRSTAGGKNTILDYWPPMTTPIVVMMEGRTDFAHGILVDLHRKNEGGWIDRDLLFIEHIPRGQKLPSMVVFPAITRLGEDGNVQNELFAAHEFNKVVAWNYLGVDGEMILPKRDERTSVLVADCEFDDSTKTLISISLVSSIGRIYYAFDTAAAHAVKKQWIIDNVNSVLLDIPATTSVVWDLNAKHKTFQEFVEYVLEQEDELLYNDVRIHVDFPTDVAYISQLFHLGEGRRIGKMGKVQFHIDYVDSYPTKVPGAVQHNAAWDAFALWHHLGYYEFLVADRFLHQAKETLLAQEKFDKVMAEANDARAERGLPPLKFAEEIHTETYQKLVDSTPPTETFPGPDWDAEPDKTT